MIRVAILAPAPALRIGLHEMMRGLPDVEMVADSALPQELPQADVWVLTSADFIDELNEEQSPPLLLCRKISLNASVAQSVKEASAMPTPRSARESASVWKIRWSIGV